MTEPLEDWQIGYLKDRVARGVYRKRVPLSMMLQAIARIEGHDLQIREFDQNRKNLLARIRHLEARLGDRNDE